MRCSSRGKVGRGRSTPQRDRQSRSRGGEVQVGWLTAGLTLIVGRTELCDDRRRGAVSVVKGQRDVALVSLLSITKTRQCQHFIYGVAQKPRRLSTPPLSADMPILSGGAERRKYWGPESMGWDGEGIAPS